jgi:hypothetical protein
MMQDHQRKSARKPEDGWRFQQMHVMQNQCLLFQLSSYPLLLFLCCLVSGSWYLVYVVHVGNLFFCYVLERWSGCLRLMMSLETAMSLFCLFIPMTMVLFYDIFCCWMVPVNELMKWGYDAWDKWSSVLNAQSITYCWPISLLGFFCCMLVM